MRRIRHRRVLATLASLLWLAVGVADAAGVTTCAYHEIMMSHAPETDPTDSSSHHDSHDPGGSAGHGTHGHHSSPLEAGGAEAPEHDCECRLACTVSGIQENTSLPVATFIVGDVSSGNPERPMPPLTEAPLPLRLAPFFLPPSIAPPLT